MKFKLFSRVSQLKVLLSSSPPHQLLKFTPFSFHTLLMTPVSKIWLLKMSYMINMLELDNINTKHQLQILCI